MAHIQNAEARVRVRFSTQGLDAGIANLSAANYSPIKSSQQHSYAVYYCDDITDKRKKAKHFSDIFYSQGLIQNETWAITGALSALSKTYFDCAYTWY